MRICFRQSMLQLALLLLAVTRPASAQRDLQDIPAPDPAVELASFQVAEGFEVNLWAADPLLAKPTQINFDRRGRLWVSSSETYPQLNVNQDPEDRILVLEDRKGDGVADHAHVFFDRLIIPGGVQPDGQGGAFVAHADELIHLSDRDGDGRADAKEVLLAGFGTEDTHHTLHRLRFGPGGLLYMLQGYYIGTHVETLYGPRRLNGGGLWCFDTRTGRLEIFSRGLVNPWGMAFDRYGQVFQTDGAGGEGINFSFPEAVFRASPHETRILKGLNPRRPKSCGLEVVSGRHMPSDWRGTLLTSDFRANNIDRYRVREDGSGFVSELLPDVIRSTHVSFRPIDMVMGPDGAIYVADWYSPIIQHGEVDFRDKRRDQVHGRIWRITAKGRPLLAPKNYAEATIGELLTWLQEEEDWVRLHAKQELKTRDEQAVEAALDAWLSELDPAQEDVERLRLEGLWTYQTISTRRAAERAEALLGSPDHRVRAAAARVLYHWRSGLPALAARAQDPHPQVRREVVSALSRFSEEAPQATVAALGALEGTMDPWLDFALWRTCRQLAPGWLPAFRRGQLAQPGTAHHWAFALKALEDPQALASLLETLRANDERGDPAVVALAGKIGSAEQLAQLVPMARQRKHPLQRAAAEALLEAARDRGVAPSQGLSVWQALVDSGDSVCVAAGFRLAGLWQRSSATALLTKGLGYAEYREAAALSLADLGEVAVLRRAASSRRDPLASRLVATRALLRVDVAAAVKSSVDLFAESLTETQVEQLMGAVVRKAGAAEALTGALADVALDREVATVSMRVVETVRDGLPALRQALAKAAGIALVDQEPSAEQLVAWRDRVAAASVLRGRELFVRESLACTRCHRVAGQGSEIGPDLSSIGTAAPVDYLLESLIAPSKKIKEGYRMTNLVTEAGDVISGLVTYEDPRVVLLRDSVGQEVRVPVREIAAREVSPLSMMPSGLTASLTEAELVDLVAYLASLGKE